MNATNFFGTCSLLVIFLSPSARLRGQDVPRTLSFDECIQTALTNSTAVVKGANAVELSGAQVLAAHGQFLPDAVVGGAFTYTGGTNLLTVTLPTLVNSQSLQQNNFIIVEFVCSIGKELQVKTSLSFLLV